MRQFFTILILVFLINSAPVVSGQKTLRRLKANRPGDVDTGMARPAQPVRDNTATSSSGKLVVSGAHVGLVGILEIEADISLEGPLLIEVSAGGAAVSQPEGDTT